MRRGGGFGLRFLVLALLIVGGLLVSAGAAAAAEVRAGAEVLLSEQINEARSAEGLGALVVDTELTRIARNWSTEMASTGELSHRPDLARQVQGPWSRLGENVGRVRLSGASETELAERVHRAFMDSTGHRRNILGDWTHVGVGVRLGGDGTLWATVNFLKGSPRPGAAAVVEGVRVSTSLFAEAGAAGRRAERVVLARADDFADSLGGTALAGDSSPVLFTPGPSAWDDAPALHPVTRAEVDRVLGGSGTVYLLGGERALSRRVEQELRGAGYTVRRLAGDDRIATAIAVAEEVRRVTGNRDEVLVATARDWADAVSAGAYAAHAGSPVLLTGAERLDPRVEAFLDTNRPTRRWALGGPAALADRVVGAARADRVWGADRFATAVAISEQLWGRTRGAAGDGFVVAHGRHADGWAFALANSPRAATGAAPQLLVRDRVPASVGSYLSGLGYSRTRPATVDTVGVNGAVRSELLQLTGGS